MDKSPTPLSAEAIVASIQRLIQGDLTPPKKLQVVIDERFYFRGLSDSYAAGRAQALREAAEVARATKSYDDNLQKSAGCYTTGERIAANIEALAKP